MRAKPVERPPPTWSSTHILYLTESNLETEEDNALIIGNVVLLAEDVLNIFLRDGSTLRMKNFNSLRVIGENYKSTIWRRLRRGFLMNFLTRTVTAASDMVIAIIDNKSGGRNFDVCPVISLIRKSQVCIVIRRFHWEFFIDLSQICVLNPVTFCFLLKTNYL